ncbi:MAG: MmcQ/YjbR family DNA-binding protein [Bacteroidota bacterium]
MIDLETIRQHCLRKPGTITEDFPFDDEVLVFRIFGKIFLLTNVTVFPVRINVKCEPERAVELRERYDAVTPGFHMHKRTWNTVVIDGSVPERVVYEMIDHSYDQVKSTLPKTILKKYFP